MESQDTDISGARRLQVVLACMVILACIVVVVGVVVFNVGLLIYSVWPRQSGPTVDHLVGNYRAHHAAFAAIVEMARTDPDFVVWNPDDERYGLPTHLAVVRERRYRKLLAEIGGEQLGSGGGEITIVVASDGLAVAGEDWNYYHSDRPQSPVDTVEQARAGGRPEGWCVSLGDGWYASYNRD